MANEDSALREVDQELAEERQWAMFRKYGPAVIGGAVAVIIAVGGWQIWNAQQTAQAKAHALEFRNAVELLEENPSEGRTALEAIAEEGGGYAALAELHRAASFAGAGERLAAIEAFSKIYNNSATPSHVRELARLRAAYLSLADGREQVMTDLGDLADGEGAFSYQAKEISGLAALDARDYETALSLFRQLSIDIGAPDALRQRAEDFAALAASGKAGVNISGETRVEDLLEAIGDEVELEAPDEGAPEIPAEDAAAVEDETIAGETEAENSENE